MFIIVLPNLAFFPMDCLNPQQLRAYYQTDFQPEAGCDEAGRGCLAGPVLAAAVILPPTFTSSTLLRDSKKRTARQREQLRSSIEQQALAFAVAFVHPSEIDEVNILQASVLAMHRALESLPLSPSFIIVDGNYFRSYHQTPHACLVKGDDHYLSIAAASILAKTYRDEYMQQLHHEYPMYGWATNKGYPTLAHRQAIAKYGISPHHRQSFTLLPANTLPFVET